ncbi:hypothetical protein ADUPG1_011132, partial [Aduncisulcus paluster]
ILKSSITPAEFVDILQPFVTKYADTLTLQASDCLEVFFRYQLGLLCSMCDPNYGGASSSTFSIPEELEETSTSSYDGIINVQNGVNVAASTSCGRFYRVIYKMWIEFGDYLSNIPSLTVTSGRNGLLSVFSSLPLLSDLNRNNMYSRGLNINDLLYIFILSPTVILNTSSSLAEIEQIIGISFDDLLTAVSDNTSDPKRSCIDLVKPAFVLSTDTHSFSGIPVNHIALHTSITLGSVSIHWSWIGFSIFCVISLIVILGIWLSFCACFPSPRTNDGAISVLGKACPCCWYCCCTVRCPCGGCCGDYSRWFKQRDIEKRGNIPAFRLKDGRWALPVTLQKSPTRRKSDSRASIGRISMSEDSGPSNVIPGSPSTPPSVRRRASELSVRVGNRRCSLVVSGLTPEVIIRRATSTITQSPSSGANNKRSGSLKQSPTLTSATPMPLGAGTASGRHGSYGGGSTSEGSTSMISTTTNDGLVTHSVLDFSRFEDIDETEEDVAQINSSEMDTTTGISGLTGGNQQDGLSTDGGSRPLDTSDFLEQEALEQSPGMPHDPVQWDHLKNYSMEQRGSGSISVQPVQTLSRSQEKGPDGGGHSFGMMEGTPTATETSSGSSSSSWRRRSSAARSKSITSEIQLLTDKVSDDERKSIRRSVGGYDKKKGEYTVVKQMRRASMVVDGEVVTGVIVETHVLTEEEKKARRLKRKQRKALKDSGFISSSIDDSTSTSTAVIGDSSEMADIPPSQPQLLTIPEEGVDENDLSESGRIFKKLCKKERVDFSEHPPSSPSSSISSFSDEAKSLHSHKPHSHPPMHSHSMYESYSSITTSLPPFLPARSPFHRFSVVIDMDHTLLHASKKFFSGYEQVIRAIDKGMMRDFYVRSRPYARELVKEIRRKGGEIIVYTAALQDYADKCLRVFDPSESLIDHRIYREACIRITAEDLHREARDEWEERGIRPGGGYGMMSYGGYRTSSSSSSTSPPHLPLADLVFSNGYMKDLSRLGESRDLSSVVIIDDNPISYALQPLTALPCREYRGEDNDEEMKLIALAVFQALEDKNTANVSGVDEAIEKAQLHLSQYRIKGKTSHRDKYRRYGHQRDLYLPYATISSFFCIKEEAELLHPPPFFSGDL